MAAVRIDVKIKIKEETESDDQTAPRHFIKTISFHKRSNRKTEIKDYQQYQSSPVGRKKIASLNVMPVSMVPSKLPKDIPAILINREVPKQRINDEFDVNLLGNCDDICQTLIGKLNWKCIQPNIKTNGNQNNDNNDNAKDEKDEKETAEGVTEYQFVEPNYCLFPNGKLPQIAINSDDDNRMDDEDVDIEKDKILKTCYQCKKDKKLSQIIFCFLENCANAFCIECITEQLNDKEVWAENEKLSGWYCPECINLMKTNDNNKHNKNTNNAIEKDKNANSNNKKRTFTEMNSDCVDDMSNTITKKQR